jgi:predicted alpha/beta superfamily hydrolase
MKSFCLVLLSGITLLSCGQANTVKPTKIIYSSLVKDSFEIYINAPKQIDPAKRLSVFYYMDANINSGKKLREMIARQEYAGKVNNTIFVGVGHTGDFHVLRRRDFILPSVSHGDTAGLSPIYGQIENFYQFLKAELIPMIDSTYNTDPGNNSILGHSLGGLFTFYCLFKNDTTFKNFYALSPSLWIDDYAIYKFNKLTQDSLCKRTLYFSSGSLEIFNRIKAGTNEMNLFLQKQNYPGLSYQYDIHKWKTHNSQVENSLDFILKR